ncbi:MAG: gliding motility-associated C-terminal domain-containing protein [Salibacteraceae bacterium]
MRILLTSILILLLCIHAKVAHCHKGEVSDTDKAAFSELKFEENKGHLPSHVFFRAYIPGGSVFLEGQTLTFDIKRLSELEAISDFKHGRADTMPETIHGHVFKVHLKNSQTPSSVETRGLFDDYVNYYLGDDESKWVSNVMQYGEVIFKNVYPGIDVRYYSVNRDFKYDFIVQPGADPADIQLEYEGVDGLKLGFDNLLIETSIEQIIDRAPVSWELENGVKKHVESRFIMLNKTDESNIISFDVKYDSSKELIIDPTLIFSTYTGSTINNWGSTATYDSLGNMYAGGYVLSSNNNGAGYPTTTGAYQTTYAGGNGTLGTDMTISKFNTAGNSLIYSTYLGGSGNEIPHSLVVNGNNQLYILGTTSSTDFPTTNNAFDGIFNGGNTIGTFGVNSNSSQIAYNGGSDIIVSKLNATGTNLMASTFIGGSGNDGINMSDTLQKAYSDEFRGEIIVDANDNCYVATSTSSSDFPTVNAFQNTFGGGITDGVIFKFNAGLNTLLWSSYIGGSEADAAYSIQFDPNFDVFCTGGTISQNFPTTNNALHSTYRGGLTDGWLAKVSNNGQNLLASTYLGTNDYDQSFFVQLDLSGFVYVVGQSLGNYPIAPAWVYSNPNSGQFLHKLTNNLQNTVFSTQWGTGNGNINLSLTAFLVNDCNHIFVSGWGGSLFGVAAPTSTGGTTTTGLPTTSNAVQTATDGHDFYFVVFEDSATSLLFASFYGGTTGAAGGEHTDGGTSRFDKKGIIYQSACASCGQASSFPSTTGAYSTTKPASASCNLAAVKYDLVTLIAEADVNGPEEVCVNDSLEFINESFGGAIYEWDFGDGNSSNEFEPKHAFSSPGVYDVVLIIIDSVSCVFSDTDSIVVTVLPGPEAVVPTYPRVCVGDEVQLNASGGSSYFWSPSTGLSDPNIANPIATVEELKTYVVTVEDSCGTDTAWVTLRVFPDFTSVGNDTAICKGQSARLRAEGGKSYHWSPPFYLSSTNSARPLASPDSTITYDVIIVDSFDCIKSHSVTVFVAGELPDVEAWGDTTICSGERVVLNASGSDSYEWFPKDDVLSPFLPSTPAFPDSSVVYIVKVENACGATSDSVVINVNPINVYASADTAVCAGDTVYLNAQGAIAYQWTSSLLGDVLYSPSPSITPSESGWYIVEGKNLQNCKKKDSTFVEVFPQPTLSLPFQEDTVTGLHNILIVAESDASLSWQSSGYLPCSSCDSIKVYPREETTYYVIAETDEGCKKLDSVTVIPVSKLFIPNSFTPDGDGINDVFLIKGHNILSFEMSIRNRWGREIYRSTDLQQGWNGRKFNKGAGSPIGAYTYTVRYTIVPGQEMVETGLITLIR